ncbi:hypothetical protein [Sphingobacterium detergens]|uniref:Outer membrane protein with beta-barrel domain n=1 Tax=Sphingobacterium detergens TaxID=1145106 RepID=A0A420BHM1_SPHD1|nr:hypothetical protein [Sphingobacterium detergens]RKE56254.1 hypothetical protein DFQ12_1110 [Sphingobacterium detergens]
MEGNKKKELIEEIIGQLKDHELPYREGSWEKFASKHGVAAPPSSAWKYWSAAAAVLLCFGVGYWSLKNNSSVAPSSAVLTQNDKNSEVLADNKDLKESIQRSLSAVTGEQGLSAQELLRDRPFTYSKVENEPTDNSQQQQFVLFGGKAVRGNNINVSNNFAALGGQTMQLRNSTLSAQINLDDPTATASTDITTRTQVATTTQSNVTPTNSNTVVSSTQTQREAARLAALYAGQQENRRGSVMLKSNNDLDRKWEMGAFVSPASTSESITLGGGVALAYNVSSKISIRSGASIQHYGAVSGNTPITPAMASNSFEMNAPNYLSQPNGLSNAFAKGLADAKDAKSNERVSGKILTVDIPVDVRYAITKNFYTSVGVSYVGVLDQERATIYETNNTEYKQKSTEKNVDDKGVNGFVNFSVGRKQKVGKLSISVEPYYKIPVGGLRSSDLNYSNGGVKIITSF